MVKFAMLFAIASATPSWAADSCGVTMKVVDEHNRPRPYSIARFVNQYNNRDYRSQVAQLQAREVPCGGYLVELRPLDHTKSGRLLCADAVIQSEVSAAIDPLHVWVFTASSRCDIHVDGFPTLTFILDNLPVGTESWCGLMSTTATGKPYWRAVSEDGRARFPDVTPGRYVLFWQGTGATAAIPIDIGEWFGRIHELRIDLRPWLQRKVQEFPRRNPGQQ